MAGFARQSPSRTMPASTTPIHHAMAALGIRVAQTVNEGCNMHPRAINVDHSSPQGYAAYLAACSAGADVTRLVEDARAALSTDLEIARECLDQLSAVLNTHPGSAAGMIDPHPRLVSNDVPMKGGLASWQIRRIDEYIEANLQTAIGIGTLSELSRLSNGHFCRAFKISMGDTPHTYIRRKRIERAQAMMMETAASLCEIACACGLSDQSHLTRLFRKYVGQTPLAWRRSWKTDG